MDRRSWSWGEAGISSSGRQRGRPWVAIVAAYLLVMQALLVGFTSGASTAPAQLDIFGHVLCAPGGGDDGDGSTDHQHGLHCHALGCGMCPTVLPAQPAIRLAEVPSRPMPAASAGADRVASDHDRLLAKPRAPPPLIA